MKVLLVAYQFPPLIVGGSFRPFMFAKYLTSNGIDPTIITLSQDSYSKIYSAPNTDYSLLNELDKSTKIIEIPSRDLLRDRKNKLKSKIPEIYNEAYYWKKNFNNSVQNILDIQDINAIIVTAPPFNVTLLVRKIALKNKIPLIIDLRDHWSLWVTNPYRTYFHYLYTKYQERLVLKSANSIITTSEVTKDDLLKQHPKIDIGKFHVIHNGYDTNIQYKTISFKPKLEIIIGYVGSFYYDPTSRDHVINDRKHKKGLTKFQYSPRKEDWLYRSPYFFFKSIKLLIDKNPKFRNIIKIKFAGKKDNWFSEMINEFSLDDIIEHVGWLSKSDSINFQQKCDFLLLTSSKVINGKDYSIAGKTFEYLELQKPMLAFVTNRAQKDLLEKTGLGIIIDPDSPDIATSVLEDIFSHGINLNPNIEFIKKFQRKDQVKELAEIIKRIVK